MTTADDSPSPEFDPEFDATQLDIELLSGDTDDESAPDDVRELPFDQYQRYRLVADVARHLRGDGPALRILDVGGRTGVLRRFLPDERIDLVDRFPAGEPGLVIGDGARLPYQDGSFDLVTACDTLEHIPAQDRSAFVAECMRVSRRAVVLAGPYGESRVDESEELLVDFLKHKLGVEHRYLLEHRTNTLPSIETTRSDMLVAGAQKVGVIGHGRVERWLALMCLALYMDQDPPLRPVARRAYRFYNEALYSSDHAGNGVEGVYRHAIVASRRDEELPTASELFGEPVLPAGTLAPFQHLIDELLAFDHSRDVYDAERQRLIDNCQRILFDLEGHKKTLAEANTDLEGHRKENKEVWEEVEGLRGIRKHLETINESLEEDLEGHKKENEEVWEEVEGLRGVRKHIETINQALEEDLEGHRKMLAELQDSLEEHKQVIADLTSLLEGERGRSEELEQRVAAGDQLAAQLDARIVRREQLIAEMRADLRSRKANLKRALARHKPTFEPLTD